MNKAINKQEVKAEAAKAHAAVCRFVFSVISSISLLNLLA
jgi:hypothetical protein